MMDKPLYTSHDTRCNNKRANNVHREVNEIKERFRISTINLVIQELLTSAYGLSFLSLITFHNYSVLHALLGYFKTKAT